MMGWRGAPPLRILGVGVNRLSIRQRLMALLLVPLLALVIFGGVIVRQRAAEAREMERVGRLAKVAVRAGELLHHSQRERGLSAGLLGAEATAARTFKQQLIHERRQTDEAIAGFQASVDELGPV